MGEIVGGVVVMAAFIAFIMWKNMGKSQQSDPFREHNEQAYWAEKEAQEPEIVEASWDDQA